MKKILFAILLMATPALAESPPASEASIRELMAMTNVRAMLDQMYGEIDGMMEQSMKDALGAKQLNAEQQKITDEFRADIMEVMRAELSWDKLEPEYLRLYQETFTQFEVDGMIAFYKSDSGKAMVEKMPRLMPSLLKMVVGLTQDMRPKLNAVREEFVAKIEAAEKKEAEAKKTVEKK